MEISKKGLTSYISFVSFLIMTVTGLVLYIEPQGRVAYWTQWEFMSLTKEGWDHIHITSSILFMLAAIYHLVLNWKVFLSYLREKATRALSMKPELLISLAVGIALVVGTIYHVPPMSTLVDISGKIKDGWVKSPDQEPPYGHAELSKLKVLTKKMGMDLKDAGAALKAAGIKVEGPEEVFLDMARKNNMSPMELYAIIAPLEPVEEQPGVWTPEAVEERFEGTGVGNKQIDWVLKEAGVDEALGMNRLMRAGLTVMSTEKMKAAASANGIAPIELLKAALINGYAPVMD